MEIEGRRVVRYGLNVGVFSEPLGNFFTNLGRGTIALLDGRADQGATLLRCKAWPQRD
jgi:hypothetical protein